MPNSLESMVVCECSCCVGDYIQFHLSDDRPRKSPHPSRRIGSLMAAPPNGRGVQWMIGSHEEYKKIIDNYFTCNSTIALLIKPQQYSKAVGIWGFLKYV
jgi:hypothetical protein